MGHEKGLPFIRNMEGVEAAFVTHEHEVYMTEGMDAVLEITNSQYSEESLAVED